MESTQLLVNKYSQLPENLQAEVLDFVEFLTLKVKSAISKKTDNEIELTNQQKSTLIKRYKDLETNPERGLKWEDKKQELYKKYHKKV